MIAQIWMYLMKSAKILQTQIRVKRMIMNP